MQQLNLGLTY